MARKRKLTADTCAAVCKRPRPDVLSRSKSGGESHPVLRSYYPDVLTLRAFILSRVPNISKRRERLIRHTASSVLHEQEFPCADSVICSTYELLDNVLVGFNSATLSRIGCQNRLEDFQQFTQQSSASTTESIFGQATVSYSEIVDFTIWLLFFRTYSKTQKPPHILCHGTSRASTTHQNALPANVTCPIPGLISSYPNEHIDKLKGETWEYLHKLLGKHGDHIIVDLVTHCGLYMPIDGPNGTLYQLSGVPLSDMIPLNPKAFRAEPENIVWREVAARNVQGSSCLRKPSDIRFVRHRMLYARAALNAKGDVALGMRHIHVFRRFPDASNQIHTIHIMKYIFPRQFNLHNVFTSMIDTRETAQPFKDYTLREDEISRTAYASTSSKSLRCRNKIIERLPKRLRDKCFKLMRKLQQLHTRCSYTQLLHYYCPFPSGFTPINCHSKNSRQIPDNTSLTDFALSPAQVSAFCQAVTAHVFPSELFDDLGTPQLNRKNLLQSIDAFVRAKRFETFTLEDVMRGMKIGSIGWLRPSHGCPTAKMSLSDFSKRKELLAELIYYIFDSFLIPLIRSNFHVTESSTDKNKLFYYRHDAWKFITDPAIVHLKSSMLEEMGNACALHILNKRTLGFSQIRLLPKGGTLRPISNLKRRAQVVKDGHTWLGKSINSVLAPAFSTLKYEKQLQPQRLGASLFSVSDIFPKLRTFRAKLSAQGQAHTPLYFVKVDVKACFDSLPQEELLRLAQSIPSCSEYSVLSHAELGPPETGRKPSPRAFLSKPKKRFHRIAIEGWPPPFVEAAEKHARTRRPNTVFVDTVVPQLYTKDQINELQSQHIGAHIVRIGKKYFRQKKGIPQGSVLSTLLCNLFYAEFEARHLDFLSQEDCVLFRLIDDFLLISTRKECAEQFLRLMHIGSPTYGIAIKPEKSLVNFDLHLENQNVPKLMRGRRFPYCGILIDTNTLDLFKDGSMVKNVKDALTVEYSHLPGQSFRRKMLSGLKIQVQTMLLDTSHNALSTVFANLYNIFVDIAVKCFEYAKCLSQRQAPLNFNLVQDISGLAFALMKSNRNKLRNSQYHCQLDKLTVQWLTSTAFLSILGKKPAKYQALIRWLQRETLRLKASSKSERARMMKVVNKRMHS